MPHWTDLFKLFTYAGAKDSLSRRRDDVNLTGAGITQPDAVSVYGNELAPTGGNMINLRQTYDMIDTTILSNRLQRYKEYERLLNIPEIDRAMNVISDEACVAGTTKIATPHGYVEIQKLAQNFSDSRFLVYCWDFQKQDYTLGWAFAPRKTKHAKETVVIALDNGTMETVTPDHLILKKNGEWIQAGDIKVGEELMPFYRLPHNINFNSLKRKQYPRIFTFNKGWVNEKEFIENWKGTEEQEDNIKYEQIKRLISSGMNLNKISEFINVEDHRIKAILKKRGFVFKELKHLYKKKTLRKVIGVAPGTPCDVYDLTVDQHHCFASNSLIFHNCQKDDDGNIMKITCKNNEIKKECEFVLFNRKMLNINRKGRNYFKHLCVKGDVFLEVVIDPNNPKRGVIKLAKLPPETMYRIETTKAKLIEFQQSKEGPDYKAIEKSPLGRTTDSELASTTAIRFAPKEVIHLRLGEDRENFNPYGQSLIEPARGPAHSLRLMEDSMLVYRLSRSTERRVFYVDVGTLPPAKVEAYVDRLKDLYKKRKVASARGSVGVNLVEERYQSPAVDEDIWVPTRPGSQTKIDTLPGAANLGEVDDALYFRQKLLTALNLPKNYFNTEDTNITRFALSSLDMEFAKFVERLQEHFEDGILELLETHLELRGYPEESYEDLRVKMTPPSDYREAGRAELTSKRIADASSIKGAELWSLYDIYRKIFKFSEEEAQEMIARNKIESLEKLRIQILAQNPRMLGVGVPGEEQSNNNELGGEPGGPNFNPNPDQPETPSMPGQGPQEPQTEPQEEEKPEKDNYEDLPDVNQEDVEKYDLEIQDYENEMDKEDVDISFDV